MPCVKDHVFALLLTTENMKSTSKLYFSDKILNESFLFVVIHSFTSDSLLITAHVFNHYKLFIIVY